MVNKDWIKIVLKADKCIQFHPAYHDRLLKYNPSKQSISLISEFIESKVWLSGLLASDDFIYFVPYSADDILQVHSRHVNKQVIALQYFKEMMKVSFKVRLGQK